MIRAMWSRPRAYTGCRRARSRVLLGGRGNFRTIFSPGGYPEKHGGTQEQGGIPSNGNLRGRCVCVFSSSDGSVFSSGVRCADGAAADGLARDCAGGECADPGTDGDGKNADGVSVVPGPADAAWQGTGTDWRRDPSASLRAGSGTERHASRDENCVYLAAEGSSGRRGAQSAFAAYRNGQYGAQDGRGVPRAHNSRAHRRHATTGAATLSARSR